MKIGYLGYGKMGKAIEQLALEVGHQTAMRISSENPSDLSGDRLDQCDVVIDFSRPEAAFEHISTALKAGVPVVSGTTGWLDRMPEVKDLCHRQNGAFFYASNFSIGVHIFFAANRVLAGLMDQFEYYRPSLHEIHHVHKLDAPSGTAISLAEILIGEIERLHAWKLTAESEPGTLPITHDRVGEVPGTHEIQYKSKIDTITFRHEAHSRLGFASGALKAAEWLIGKKGVYGMDDMLGLKKNSIV